MCLLYVSVATALVGLVELKAKGSGIPEIKCYLNGVWIHRVIAERTLLSKVIGIIFADAGGMIIGKEGPCVHMGAILGAIISQGRFETTGSTKHTTSATGCCGKFDGALNRSNQPNPSPTTGADEDANATLRNDTREYPKLRHGSLAKWLRTDLQKRDFVSIGCACGVASAFGAPVGGVLFMIEEASSFYKQELFFRATFATTLNCVMLFLILTPLNGGDFPVNEYKIGALQAKGVCDFGKITTLGSYNILDIALFAILGVLMGLFAALFNHTNKLLTQWRQKYVTNPSRRMTEALVVAIVTATVCFVCSYSDAWCADIDNLNLGKHASDYLSSFNCAEGQYNEAATLFLQQLDRTVAALVHTEDPDAFSATTLLLYFVIVWGLACWTYGIAIPSGLFIPSIAMGAVGGRLFGLVVSQSLYKHIFDDVNSNHHHVQACALVGGAAFLGGTTRMTVSIVMISLSTIEDYAFLVPIMVGILSAKLTGDAFNEGLYDIHIKLQGITTFLEHEPTCLSRRTKRSLVASDLMVQPVVLQVVESCAVITRILATTRYNGFPVVDDRGLFRGTILRSQLSVMLLERQRSQQTVRDEFLSHSDFLQYYPRFPRVKDLPPGEDIDGCMLDLEHVLNGSALTVTSDTHAHRVYRLFRHLGVRHLPVLTPRGAVWQQGAAHEVVGIITRKDLHTLESEET
mmetsp:Transcript_18009/g.42184  ORF Transcript_18009/g.42184 Transcript_18009/m.42184 type:complete len:689 (+) Transcript_18009:873-2939(+)